MNNLLKAMSREEESIFLRGEYIVCLVGRVVTVSVETVKLIEQLSKVLF